MLKERGDLDPEMDRAVGALQDPTRRAILLDFYQYPQTARTVDEVAGSAAIHRSVAFGHLERLVSLGYLAMGKRRGRSGKPANLYRLAGERIELNYPARRFLPLATLLATGLKEFGREGVQTAQRVGRRFGASLVRRRAGTVAGVLRELVSFGGSYRSEADLVEARNCVFREACEAAPEIICHLHAGVLEGALEEAGVARRVVPLTREPGDTCRFRVSAPT